MRAPRRPTPEELKAAVNKSVPDVIAPGLKVLFCGINPGLYSGAVGHHFARPGNRFWPALYAAGFTNRLLSPCEEQELLKNGYGITNIVNRTTASADELSRDELARGAVALIAKVEKYAPDFLAVLGVQAYRHAFNRPDAKLGLQPECLGTTRLWVLPNPSGLNAHYQAVDFAELFGALKRASDSPEHFRQ